MRLLLVHNQYRWRGGEDVCVDREETALRQAGFEVQRLGPKSSGSWRTGWSAAGAPWGVGESRAIEQRLLDWRPDVLHVHNLVPMLSTRIFAAARKREIPVVQTLHNYRPLCLNGLSMTPAGEVCQRCRPGHYAPGILRGCYRGSRMQSAALAVHWTYANRQGWLRDADRWIAPSAFLKSKFGAYGWPESKIMVQEPFLPAEAFAADPIASEPAVLYLGRLSDEKGILWLLRQFSAPARPLQLWIAGDGPRRSEVEKACGPHIRYLGTLSGPQTRETLRRVAAVVLPSLCYENFPLTLAEAGAHGVPAVVSDHGSLASLVQGRAAGFSFPLNDVTRFWAALDRINEGGAALRRRCLDEAHSRFSQTHFIEERKALYAAVCSTSRAAV